ncbi:MAG: hypothetical protein ABUL64_01925, partial [Singulisphaera sp.]
VLARRQRIDAARFQIIVIRAGDMLFATPDANHDQRLGAREIAGAAARLLKCDADGDGRLAPGEIPDRTVVRLVHGAVANNGSRASVPVRSTVGPSWFERMDNNGDGDVSPTEFLGSADRFAEIDENRDGFLDVREAARLENK